MLILHLVYDFYEREEGRTTLVVIADLVGGFVGGADGIFVAKLGDDFFVKIEFGGGFDIGIFKMGGNFA